MDAPKKSLVKKLAEVMGEVERVAKSGRNNFHNYDYATEADIVSSVRGGLAVRGVMLVPSIQKIEWTEKPGPKPSKIATITVLFTFMDGDSGEKVEFIGMGQGEDASDKAIYKAMTGAEKYALLKTFLIPTGDDPDKDEAPAQRSQPQRQVPAPAPSVKQQLKAPPVVPTPAPAAAPKPAGPPQPWERLEIYCKENGYLPSAGWSVLKGLQERKVVSGEMAKKGDLTEAALTAVIGELSRAKQAQQQVEKTLGQQQPVEVVQF